MDKQATASFVPSLKSLTAPEFLALPGIRNHHISGKDIGGQGGDTPSQFDVNVPACDQPAEVRFFQTDGASCVRPPPTCQKIIDRLVRRPSRIRKNRGDKHLWMQGTPIHAIADLAHTTCTTRVNGASASATQHGEQDVGARHRLRFDPARRQRRVMLRSAKGGQETRVWPRPSQAARKRGPPLQACLHSFTRQMPDDTAAADPAGQGTGQECGLFQQHLVGRDIWSGDPPLCQRERQLRKIRCQCVCRRFPLGTVQDNQVRAGKRDRAQVRNARVQIPRLQPVCRDVGTQRLARPLERILPGNNETAGIPRPEKNSRNPRGWHDSTFSRPGRRNR